MTDEKKELPWPEVYECKPEEGLVPRWNFVDADGFGTHFAVPKLEAIRLHTLDERVKKFEKAARMLLELHHLTQFTTEQKNRRHAQFIEPRIDRETQSKLCDIFELFREAMGEK